MVLFLGISPRIGSIVRSAVGCAKENSNSKSTGILFIIGKVSNYSGVLNLHRTFPHRCRCSRSQSAEGKSRAGFGLRGTRGSAPPDCQSPCGFLWCRSSIGTSLAWKLPRSLETCPEPSNLSILYIGIQINNLVEFYRKVLRTWGQNVDSLSDVRAIPDFKFNYIYFVNFEALKTYYCRIYYNLSVWSSFLEWIFNHIYTFAWNYVFIQKSSLL